MQVEKPLDVNVDLHKYQCLLGVPYGYKDVIGYEAYFINEQIVLGPWLIVDVESNIDAGTMKDRRLVADINCTNFVSMYGALIINVSSTGW